VSSSVFVISDNETLGLRVREILNREGEDVPVSHVLPFDTAVGRLANESADLVVVLLPSDLDHVLSALAVLEGRVGARVVAVGPASDPKLMLRALRGGIDDYLDEADLETELRTALSRWRTARVGQVQVGRMIALLAPSGGSGSSTLSVNIAAALAKEHKTSALIDLKLHAGDLAALLDLKPNHSLADLCLNVSRIDRVFFEHTLARHQSGIHLLAAPRTLADVAHVNPEGVRQALIKAKAAFPYVVVDLDHSFHDEQTVALLQADIILLVLRLDFTSLRNCRRALEHMDQIGVGRDRVRLVVNRYGQPKEVPAAKAEEALGVKIAHYVPDDPKTVNRANNNGVPLIVEAPSAKVTKSVLRLAHSVNGRHTAS
jgi:pilus assembly protein CpaE